jgi:hypothetical protein
MYHFTDALLRFSMQQGADTKDKLRKATALLKQTVRHRTVTTFICSMTALSGVQFDGNASQQQLDLVSDSLKVSSRCGDLVSMNHMSNVLARSYFSFLNFRFFLSVDLIFLYISVLYQNQGDLSNQALQMSQATAQNKALQEKRDAAAKIVAEIALKFEVLLSDGQKNKLLRQKQNAKEIDGSAS